MLGTINKAGRVLSLFTIEHPEWGLSEIARQLHSPRSTVYELLASLVEIGALSRTLQGRYRLGLRMVSFSHLFLRTSLVNQCSTDTLKELSDQFNESAQIAILDDLEIVIVNTIKSGVAANSNGAEGARYPAHCNAMGKILLAEQDWDAIKPILETRGLKPFSPNTITSIDRLHTELDDVRRRGWAESVGEMMPGIAAIAAGVRGENGQIAAAISISLPLQRYMDVRDEARNLLISACARTSACMGYRDSKPAKPALAASAPA